MRRDNIFITGGKVSGDSMIGYEEKIDSLTGLIKGKLNNTGGIYVHGLYRMGKSSLMDNIVHSIDKKYDDLVCISVDLNLFNTNSQNKYEEFLVKIIKKLRKKLEEMQNANLEILLKKIPDPKSIELSEVRWEFDDIFNYVKSAGLKVLLIIDEFDAAKDIFTCKGDFELFRELTASEEYSVCLVTVSRQELSLIENVNPNNSSFKGVMYPFPVKGFDDNDVREYRRVMKEFYDYELSDEDVDLIDYHSGSSPYLWSCIGFEIAERRLRGKEVCMEEILVSAPILSKINGFHESVFKCLDNDKDRNGVTFAEKLVSILIGPSFLATDEDIKLLIGMDYLIDTGDEYIAFSYAFKKYLMEISYSNDILSNFDTLEKKMKLLLEQNKDKLFNAVAASDTDEDENWFKVLSDTWSKIESRPFSSSGYKQQIRKTSKTFRKTETVLNVMSLEDATRIVRNYWNIFAYKFNGDTLDKWEIKFKDCGTARNPVHHGSVCRIYTAEEQVRVNSYCEEIIKQLS